MATKELKNEYNLNADACSNHPTGFRIKYTMTEKSELSSSGPTGGSTKHHCRMDTPVKPEHDRKREAEHDISTLCHSALDAESIKQQCRMDSRLRRNDRGECGHSIPSRSFYGEQSETGESTLPLSPSGPTGGSTKQSFRLAQSGRSMVEMLGTLAIIGVLSVGGIAGYSYGMDKYRANTTMQDIQLRAVDLLAQIQNKNDDPTLDSWSNEKTIYQMSLVFDDESNDPLIQVSNVPERVCEMIVKDMETQAAITVNSYYTVGQEDGGCEEQNDLTFYFGDYEVCGTDYCSGDTAICHPDTQTCVECLNSGDCPSDKPVCNASNVCEPCPESKPFYDASTGVCGDCQSDDDCPNNGWCLYNKSLPVNSDVPRNFNNCVTPTYKDVLSAEESPDGKKWIYATITGYGSMWNGPVICSKFGMVFPYPEDFIVGCVNPQTSCSGDKTDTAIAIQNADTKRHIRVQGVDPTDKNKGFILDLQSWDTGARGYYYRGSDSMGIYCRSE